MIGSPRNGNFRALKAILVSFQSENSVENWSMGSLDSKKQVKENKVSLVLELQRQSRKVCLPVS